MQRFFSTLLVFLGLISCDVAPPPGPPKISGPVTLASEQIELESDMSDSEKLSLQWLLSVLTNRKVFEKFNDLCGDYSPKQNLDECLQEAQKKLFDILSISAPTRYP